MDDLAQTLKALAEPTRLRILALLQEGERCVCDVEATLGITQSRCSRHLKTLSDAGFLDARRDGAWVHYRIRADLQGPAADLLAALAPHLGSIATTMSACEATA